MSVNSEVTVPLTDFAVRNAKPHEKPSSLGDDDGLHLYVTSARGMLWRLQSRLDGQEKQLAIGP